MWWLGRTCFDRENTPRVVEVWEGFWVPLVGVDRIDVTIKGSYKECGESHTVSPLGKAGQGGREQGDRI